MKPITPEQIVDMNITTLVPPRVELERAKRDADESVRLIRNVVRVLEQELDKRDEFIKLYQKITKLICDRAITLEAQLGEAKKLLATRVEAERLDAAMDRILALQDENAALRANQKKPKGKRKL